MKWVKTFVTVMRVLSMPSICLSQVKDTLSVIHSRKSVRHYTGQQVSKKDLETLVKAGMAAPTASDKRPWAFVIVTDEATLKKLAEGLPYSKRIVLAKSAIIVCGVLTREDWEHRDYWVMDCTAATENILLAAEAMGLGAVWTGVYPRTERVVYIQRILGIPRGEVIPLNIVAVGFPTGEDRPKDKFDPANIHWEKW